jgi:N-acetylneuraminate synthase
MDNRIFHELFVLELANNHLGRLERGMSIVHDFGRVVRHNGVRAAIKLQIRDVDSFIHPGFRDRADIRYVRRTLETRLTPDEYAVLTEEIRRKNCLRMATPFDEASVDLCVALNMDLLKLASSDINDWPLIEKVATARRPVIASTGGSSLKDVDDLVRFFRNRGIPLALNHCVSIYPSEDAELQLNQVDFLRDRYPDNVIGLSTHEQRDWALSIAIAYAKGARTFERHIDIDADGVAVAPYCTRPEQADEWFRAFRRAKEMCGGPGTEKRVPPQKEIAYLDALVRGVYARRDLPAGHALVDGDYYLAIPLQKGQISCRELVAGEVLLAECPKDAPIRIEMLDSPYSRNPALKAQIERRGI